MELQLEDDALLNLVSKKKVLVQLFNIKKLQMKHINICY